MDLLRIAFIFGFVLICLIVFLDWLRYLDLQRRLKKGRDRARELGIRNAEIILGVALEDIDALVPVVVSDSTAPGEALFIAPDVFNQEGEIDPGKIVYIKNLEEMDDPICPHCHMPIKIRNPSGYCDHLYYPESCTVCQELNNGKAGA